MRDRLWKRALRSEPLVSMLQLDEADLRGQSWPGFTPDAYKIEAFDDGECDWGLVTILEVENTHRISKHRKGCFGYLHQFLDNCGNGWELRVLVASPRIIGTDGLPVVSDLALSDDDFPDYCYAWRERTAPGAEFPLEYPQR